MSIITAGILIIGDEILSGRTKDTNANFIAKNLILAGIKLEEIRVIQDKKKIIINSVKSFSSMYSYVFTTGGIGPTHDDITAESLAEAFDKEYKINLEAFNILKNYYPNGEFNLSRQKMAKMPSDAQLIYNPLTAAPGFIIKNIYVLPGVPEIMEKMLIEVLKTIKKGAPKKIITINTNLFESTLALFLENLQKEFSECSIGSYPYFGFKNKTAGLNIVVSSWTMDSLEIIKTKIVNEIKNIGGKSNIV